MRRQRLADVHRSGYHQLRRRHVDSQENPALRRLLHAAFGHAQPFFEHSFRADLLTFRLLSPAAARRSPRR